MHVRLRQPLHLAPAAAALLLMACATPIEIKQASQRQLELIDALDDGVLELRSAIEDFHREQAALIREDGRMQVARAAIMGATDEDRQTTADALFELYEDDVYPWITSSIDGDTITEMDERIGDLEEKINETGDPLVRAMLTVELNDLRLERAKLDRIPADVATIATTVRQQLAESQATSRASTQSLDHLRTQIALMREMQARVDAWLSVDVSPSQEQVDALRESLVSARDAMGGDGQ